jgi:asparagine synthetase B (glutamine-hydrolysing)
MPRTSFLARIADRTNPPTEVDWRNIGPRWVMSLRGTPPGARLFTWDAMVLLLRGIVRLRDSSGPLDPERVAAEIRMAYLENGSLPADRLEGGFSIVLLDAATERALLYRNLAAAGPLYYRPAGSGLLLGSSLAELIASGTVPTQLADEMLPAYFLSGLVPGGDTLAAGCQRVLPGEEIRWERGRLSRRQVQSLADLGGEPLAGSEAVAALGGTLGLVLSDAATLHKRPATILTGGVASSYVQAVANTTIRAELLPGTYSVSLDHPSAWAATEQTMFASRGLGTEHRLIPLENDFAPYLLETIAALGAPPVTAGMAYLPVLARALVKGGHEAGLSGLGAGALFGTERAASVHRAEVLRSLLPVSWLRWGVGSLARAVGYRSLADACWLADHPDNGEDDPRHPLNGISPAEVATLRTVFGPTALNDGLAQRRDVLSELGATGTLSERFQALSLIDALEMASQATELFNAAGLDLVCPFLDSRLVNLAARLRPEDRYPAGRPRDLVAQALRRHLPADLVRPRSCNLAPPVAEWLAPGGSLRRLLDQSVPPGPASAAFLFRWLQLDLWRRTVLGGARTPLATRALTSRLARSNAA